MLADGPAADAGALPLIEGVGWASLTISLLLIAGLTALGAAAFSRRDIVE